MPVAPDVRNSSVECGVARLRSPAEIQLAMFLSLAHATGVRCRFDLGVTGAADELALSFASSPSR